EGLEPMARDDRCAGVPAGKFFRLRSARGTAQRDARRTCRRGGRREGEGLRDILRQFAHEHRWRCLAVVANRLADVTQVETLPRAEECLEKKVTVILAAGAVAQTWLARHEIEAQVAGGPRERLVVHPDQTDDFEGNAA